MKKVLYILILINLIFLSINLSYILKSEPETIVQTESIIEETNISKIDETGNIYLSKTDQIWALETARQTVIQYLTDTTIYAPIDTPEIFLTQPKKIFVTLHNQETHELRACKGATGATTLLESLTQASIGATKDARFDNLDEEEMENVLIEINILNPEEKFATVVEGVGFELGIDGIYFTEENGLKAIFLPNVPIAYNYDYETLIGRLCKKSELEETCYEDSKYEFYKFTTFDFVENGNDGSTELYRYNNYIDSIDRENVEEMLASAGTWLSDNMQENGEFKYIYYPSKDDYSDSYNLIRHIGSTYTLLQLYEYYGDAIYLEKASKGIEYFSKYIKTDGEKSYLEYDDGAIKLGASALAIITLDKNYKLTGDIQSLEMAKSLGNFILSMQKEDGSFQDMYPEESDDVTMHELYWAEANLALARLFAETGETEYLSALQKSYEQTKTYFEETESQVMVPWNITAFSELYYITENQNYADLAYEMADWVIDTRQYEESYTYQDYVGGFSVNGIRDQLTVSTGAFAEGIGDALKLSKYQGDETHKEKYKESMSLALQYLVNVQYRGDNSFYLKNPNEAIGGFRASMYDNSERIDYSQHSISAIIKAIESYVY